MEPEIIPDAPGRQRIGLPQLERLRALHEELAHGLGTSLGVLLRTPVDAKLGSVEQLTYGQFAYNVQTPACFYILKADGLKDRAMLDIEPSILHPMIDRLLGGAGDDDSAPERPLTEIEWSLAGRLVRLFFEECRAAWRDVIDLRLDVLQTESDPRLLRALPAEEPVVLVSLRVAMGELWGDVRLCLPARAIERLSDRLSLPAATSRPRPAAGPLAEVRVTLAETPIAEAQLADLRVGDIIATETAAGSPAVVLVDGVARFRAKAGVCQGRKAARITETLESLRQGATAGLPSDVVGGTGILPVTDDSSGETPLPPSEPPGATAGLPSGVVGGTGILAVTDESTGETPVPPSDSSGETPVPPSETAGATAGLPSSVELRVDGPADPSQGKPRPSRPHRRHVDSAPPRQKGPGHE